MTIELVSVSELIAGRVCSRCSRENECVTVGKVKRFWEKIAIIRVVVRINFYTGFAI